MSAESKVPFTTDPDLQQRTRDYLVDHRTWERYGELDQRGAANLITPERRLAALATVRSGVTISLSRPMQAPPEHAIGLFANTVSRSPQFGDALMRTAEDTLELRHHGNGLTHLDALCHVWLEGEGMWNGRDPDEELAATGSRWADVSQLRDGLLGRAVLLDVPAYRGVDFVEVGEPVTRAELDAVAASQGSSVEPGDMLAIYCGRERWETATDPARSYAWTPEGRAGLGPDCVEFIHDNDVSVLLWDMLETELLTVHGILWAFGVPIVDNCDFGRLVTQCRESGHYDFCLTLAPLVMPGATGCAINPIALL